MNNHPEQDKLNRFKDILIYLYRKYQEKEIFDFDRFLQEKEKIKQNQKLNDFEFEQIMALLIHINPYSFSDDPGKIAGIKADLAPAFIENQKLIFQYDINIEIPTFAKIVPTLDEIEKRKSDERIDAANKIYADPNEKKREKIIDQIATKKSGVSAIATEKSELIRMKSRIDTGDALKDEIARDYLLAIKKDIESKKNWKVRYSGGIVVPGLNNDDPIPDTVANIYKHIKEALDRGDYWQNILHDFKPHMQTADKKSKEWNFFWKRNKDTIEFYKNFSQRIANLENLLNQVDTKITKPEPHHNHHR